MASASFSEIESFIYFHFAEATNQMVSAPYAIIAAAIR